jgi:tRNA-2-methylthio-N6-dimethylallyladenosine synthase
VAPKYLIETAGCQMNVHDSERMAGLLEQAGYESTPDSGDADILVINTCSVRERAEDKLYTRLGELRVMEEEAGSGPIVVVAGCVAQQEGAALFKNTNGHVIDVVLGTQQVKMLPTLAIQASRAAAVRSVAIDPWDDVSFPLGVVRRSDPVRAYVTIIEGCNDHCAFCVVPHTRGAERMRLPQDILDEVREAVDSGRKEIHLLGQIVNHYQSREDPSYDFSRLLEGVNAIPGVARIRFASPHPRHTGPRLIAAIRNLEAVCKHVHLPVQSGSTAVLKVMRRRHSREDYLRLIDSLRQAIPNVTLSTDMIVGFPGETKDDFDKTLSLTREVRFSSMFSFKYSVRPHTTAARDLRDSVEEEEKTARIVELQALQRDIQSHLHEELVGATVEVLTDAVSRRRRTELSGRTSGNTVVNFPGREDRIGEFAQVTVKRAGPYSVWGEAHDEPVE